MAEKLTEFDFPAAAKRHPWKQYLDGSIWRLVQGEDFHNDRVIFRTQAYAAARRMGLKVHVSMTADEPGVLIMQAVPTTTGENT